MEKGLSAIVGVIGGFIVLAIWSVALSKNSQGPQVIQSFGTAIANIISAAVSPTTGNVAAVNTGASAGSVLNTAFSGTLGAADLVDV